MSSLPSNMQAKKAELSNPNPASEPVVGEEPKEVPSTPASKLEEQRVTISKEEFNELQAKAERVKAAEGRLQAVQNDLGALQTRLTELEKGSKGEGGGAETPPAPSPSASLTVKVTAEEVPLTAKEIDDFEEDTLALMHKIAGNVFSKRIKELLPQLEGALASLNSQVVATSTQVAATRTDTFTERVKEKVAEFSTFDAVVSHKHWCEFVESEEANSGEQYKALIQKHLEKGDLNRMVAVFKTFFDKYMKEEEKPAGYQGVDTASATMTPPGGKESKVLKFSERQKAHKAYLNKDISFDEYEAIKNKFNAADAAGLVDYDN